MRAPLVPHRRPLALKLSLYICREYQYLLAFTPIVWYVERRTCLWQSRCIRAPTQPSFPYHVMLCASVAHFYIRILSHPHRMSSFRFSCRNKLCDTQGLRYSISAWICTSLFLLPLLVLSDLSCHTSSHQSHTYSYILQNLVLPWDVRERYKYQMLLHFVNLDFEQFIWSQQHSRLLV